MVHIAVLGCGTMGLKIAGNFAYCGHTVRVYDSDLNQLDTAARRICTDRDKLYRDGLIEEPLFAGQVLTMQRLEDALKDVEFVFECVVEELKLKQDLFDNVAKFVGENVILCSNTLQLNLNEIAENLPHKENLIGVRFLFPVYYIREVELNLSKYSNIKTIENVRKLLESMEKILFFRSGSRPFILNNEQQEARRQICFQEIQRRKMKKIINNSMLPDLSEAPTSSEDDFPSTVEKESIGENSLKIEKENLTCSICSNNQRNTVIRPCNHFATCFTCAERIRINDGHCPICRGRMRDIMIVFV